MTIRTIVVYLFIGLLAIWIVIASVRTIYNFSKIITEEKEWITLSDTQKNEKYFGSIFSLLQYTSAHTSLTSRIGFYSGGREFYLGRYELYPRTTIWYQTPQKLIADLKKKKVNYAILYPSTVASLAPFQEAHLKIISQTTDKKGRLYSL